MTFERVRVCKRDGARLATPHELAELHEAGLDTWVKLTVHAGEDTRHAGRPLYVELVRRLRAAGAGGATALRGIWGYHGDRPPRGDKLLSLRRHVPISITVVDTPARVARWFEIVDQLTDEAGVVTSELVPTFRTNRPSRPGP
jgi:PII-like signaling protein